MQRASLPLPKSGPSRPLSSTNRLATTAWLRQARKKAATVTFLLLAILAILGFLSGTSSDGFGGTKRH
jgi:hypothetical protein